MGALEGSCTIEEMVPYNAAPQTQKGAPATIDGALQVTVLSGSGTFIQDPGNPVHQVMLVSGSTPDDTVYDIGGDPNPDPGVDQNEVIHDTVTMHYSNPRAVSLGGGLGVAVPKP